MSGPFSGQGSSGQSHHTSWAVDFDGGAKGKSQQVLWDGQVVAVTPATEWPGPRGGQRGVGIAGCREEQVTRSMLAPFEFKSGKEYSGHRGQVCFLGGC